MRIHVFGASGSGTTSLGRSLATRLDCQHFDIDDYFWLPSDRPFSAKRPRDERVALLRRDLEARTWVLSGSMVGWGDEFIDQFTLAVFLYAPQEVRLERLRVREHVRHRERIAPGGDMHRHHLDFIEWASSYDTSRTDVRSKTLHEAWIEKLPCKVLRIDALRPSAELADTVMLLKQ